MRTVPKYVARLTQVLRDLTEVSAQFRSQLLDKRSAAVPSEQIQNMYQPGVCVLVERPEGTQRPNKLDARYAGPFTVEFKQVNDVICKHICAGIIQKFHIERLKPFWGSDEKTDELSARDYNQFVVRQILHLRGDPLVREIMKFFVVFADGDEVWVPWSHNLDCLVPYEDYIRSRPE